MLSNKTKYAIKALVALARNYDKPMIISAIAEQEKIPKKFLEAILLDLKKQGILGSKIGIGGGYYLLRKPKDVFLTQVLRTIGGPIALLPCVSLTFYERCEDCKDEFTCSLRDVALKVRDASLAIFAETNLEDMVEREKKLKKQETGKKSKKNS
jgi:Rrf2 family protein